jgi:hypothetical protein
MRLYEEHSEDPAGGYREISLVAPAIIRDDRVSPELKYAYVTEHDTEKREIKSTSLDENGQEVSNSVTEYFPYGQVRHSYRGGKLAQTWLSEKIPGGHRDTNWWFRPVRSGMNIFEQYKDGGLYELSLMAGAQPSEEKVDGRKSCTRTACETLAFEAPNTDGNRTLYARKELYTDSGRLLKGSWYRLKNSDISIAGGEINFLVARVVAEGELMSEQVFKYD